MQLVTSTSSIPVCGRKTHLKSVKNYNKFLHFLFRPQCFSTSTNLILGLSIVKGIVDKHGSEIRMASEPSTGTTFWFELPLEGSDSDQLLLKSARKNWELENDKSLIK